MGFYELGGSWDLETTCNWTWNPTCNWDRLYEASQGDYQQGYEPSHRDLVTMRLQVGSRRDKTGHAAPRRHAAPRQQQP